MLSLPDTSFLLDYVRPDFLFFRVVSRALVLWDDVSPTEDWVDRQVPAVIKKHYTDFGLAAYRNSGLAGLSNFGAMSMDEDDNKSKTDKRRQHSTKHSSSSGEVVALLAR